MITALLYLVSFLSGAAAAQIIALIKRKKSPKSTVTADFEAILKY